MACWQYQHSGLIISSEIELPEWEPFYIPEKLAQTDVKIFVKISNEPYTYEPKHIVTSNEYHFYLPEIGCFEITAGNQIAVTHLPTVEPLQLRLFLLGSAWCALCYQRGFLAIHAGAVQIGNGAVLLCAKQGKGKSTMTAWMVSKGHGLISDDLCCVDTSERGRPAVYPSTQRLRLCDDALEELGWKNKEFKKDYYKTEKHLVPWPVKPLTHAIPLRTIYLLEWGELNLVRLSGINALKRFITSATYRGGLIHRMGISSSYWQQCLDIIETVPIWELSRPKNLQNMDEVVETLESHLQNQHG